MRFLIRISYKLVIVSEFICMLNFKKYLPILIGELDSSAAENFGEAY